MKTSLRRSGGRPATALLAGLVLAAGLTACGSDGDDDTATDPAGSTSTPSATDTPSETPSETPTDEPPSTDSGGGAAQSIKAIGSAGITDAQLVSATEGGGSASTMAFALDTDLAVSEFVAGLEGTLRETVTSTVTQVAEQSPDATPYGAVVSVGCEEPRGVAIEAGEAGFEVIPQLPKSNIQCLAPMTFVVVFAAPDA